MNKTEIKLRSILSDNFLVIVLALVVGILLGVFIVYGTYVEPGTATERYEESSWSSTAEYAHSAVVVEESDLFAEGQILENRASYFEALSPELDGVFSYQYQATDGGDVDAETTLTLVLRATGEGEDGETIEYWRVEERLNESTAESVAPGETITTAFQVNITEANEQIADIEEQVGSTPGTTEIAVESELSFDGVRNEQPFDETERYEATIDSTGAVYSVDNVGPHTDSDETLGERTVEATHGPLRTFGGPLLAMGAGIGLLAIGIARQRDRLAVSQAEREWLRYQSVRDEFDEWITEGSLPEDVLQQSNVSVQTLDGLVDVAIDSNRRVIEDVSRQSCLVVLDNLVYRYEIPPVVLEARNEPLSPGASNPGDSLPELDKSRDGSDTREDDREPEQSEEKAPDAVRTENDETIPGAVQAQDDGTGTDGRPSRTNSDES